MTKALLIVDVQNDFTEGGSLATDGGAEAAAKITEYLGEHADDYLLICSSQDWHDADNDNGGHFAAEPDYVDTWPVHCVAGTAGADYHPALETDYIDVAVKKGQGVPAYSAFQGRTDDGETLANVLHQAEIDGLDVVGIATDHCVRASALDARAEGFEVRVLLELTSAVGPQSRAAAIDEMRAAGVVVE